MAPPKKTADPFADESPDEAQTQTPKTTKKENTVSDDVKKAMSVTLKAGAGYNAPWTVIYGDNPEEVNEILDDPALKGTLQRSAELAGYYADQMPAKDPAPKGNGGGSTPAGADVPAWAQGQKVPDCDHGPMVAKSGITKSGKNAGNQWKAWMCPAPQGADDQCKPKFI